MAHKYRCAENAGKKYRLYMGSYQAEQRGDIGLRDFLATECKYLTHITFGGLLSAPRSGLTTVRLRTHDHDEKGLYIAGRIIE